MIHKKRKSVHVFESLARLAYNKGTALFRGNDPLRRSAAETFSLIINTSTQTHVTCSTWLRQEWRQKHGKATDAQYMSMDERINQERLVLQKHILSYQPTQRQKVTCSLSLTIVVECCFCIKQLNKLNQKSAPEKYGPEPKEYVEEVRQACVSALLSERPAVVEASHMKPSSQKQHRTLFTKDQSVGSRQS